MATSSITIPTMRIPIRGSKFLGQTHLFSTANWAVFPPPKVHQVKVMAKFNLWEVMGGRGLCNGEKGIEKELKRSIEDEQETSKAENQTEKESDDNNVSFKVPEDGFEKEMMGLTGGFPGGEKGLKTFIEKNPPPPPPPPAKRGTDVSALAMDKKPKAPELPLLMPGMIAIVKNKNSPYHMYCGIVQRITDGKAGVLFEGGNWDRLITFRLEELERREKGPPGKNPKSCVLEPLIEQMQKEEAAP
ncbi:NAD(P)H-quinone oxidoreductase subunit S [Cardamine amara subsp. amara]|uniref:NAD(P)H-quinone oxidoreductase subunit S n=1 Tax=Cardamine amara subsp. amara TaxID=228776 RepID=A0ABD1BZN7_CARAN